MSPAGANRAFTLQEPSLFLYALTQAGHAIQLDDVVLSELWALAGLAARARLDCANPLSIEWKTDSPAHRFATAIGFDEVLHDAKTALRGETGRTVRLSRVTDETEIKPVAYEIAKLLAGETPQTASALTVEYVIIELLRNVLQHSNDPLGAVVGAQLNDKGRHAQRPVFQVAVADCGRGIRASLARTHTDVFDDDVALEQSLWPYHSGAFAPGQSGGLENAGLGLFYISEMAKAVSGRLLLSSGSASLVVDSHLPRHIERLPVGYSGTLVAFEVPVESHQDFAELFEQVSEVARKQSPKRMTTELLKFDSPPPGTTKFMVNSFLENNDDALKLSQSQLIPRMVKGEPVSLDFVNVRIITQSFAHALLFDALRFAWAGKAHIYVQNAQPVVRSALRHVEMYSQTG